MNKKSVNYNFFGILVLSLLIVFGIWILVVTGATKISNHNMLNRYISSHGLEAFFAIFFIIVGLSVWYNFICDVIIRPKHKVLYLKEKTSSIYTFLDKQGKKYVFMTDDLIETNEFYDVIKTKNEIKSIIGKTNATYRIPKEKISYWLNFYTPIGNFERILVLPIAYLFFLPFFLSFIMEEGKNKIYGGVLMILPLLFILYDFIYKIKIKIASNSLDQENIEQNMNHVRDIINKYTFIIFPFLIAISFLIYIMVLLIKGFLTTNIFIMKLLGIPPIICIFIAIIAVIARVLKKENIYEICIKIIKITLILFFIAFLGFFVYQIFIQ